MRRNAHNSPTKLQRDSMFIFSNIHVVELRLRIAKSGQDTRAVQAGYKHPVPCATPNSHRPVPKLPSRLRTVSSRRLE